MGVPRVNRAQRYLVPSIADFLFVGVVFTAGLRPTIFHDGDTGWHLWAGAFTLDNGPGAIPDALSFTRAGAPWHNVEWLGEVLLALFHRHAGYMGVAVLCSVLLAATLAWMYRILVRETGDSPAALVATVLAAQLITIQYLARPLIFSFPLFLATVELLRKPGPGRRNLVLLPLITMVWANLHPSAYLAPAMGVFAWLRNPRSPVPGVAAFLALVALGATPWGYSWIPDMVVENRAYFGHVEEWAPPKFNELRAAPYLVALVLAVALRRGGAKLSGWETIWGLGWMTAALLSARLGPYAGMAWAPFLARDLAQPRCAESGFVLARVWRGLQAGLSPLENVLRPRLWPVLVGAGALVFSPYLANRYPQVARGFPDEHFPRAALGEAARLELGPRVFNRYSWGGFVSWESEGRWKTFIDGRAGFFGADMLEDYLTVWGLRPGWSDVLHEFEPDWILLPADAPLISAAPLGGGWTVAYRDSVSAILVPVASGPNNEPS